MPIISRFQWLISAETFAIIVSTEPLSILSVRDRASLIDVLNENQRMQQW
jgi:hypothetical protein